MKWAHHAAGIVEMHRLSGRLYAQFYCFPFPSFNRSILISLLVKLTQ